MLKNITARPIMIKQGVKVAVIEAANVVPKILVPKEIGGGMEAVSKSAQGGINTKNPTAILQNWKESLKQKWTKHHSLQSKLRCS